MIGFLIGRDAFEQAFRLGLAIGLVSGALLGWALV